MTTQVHSTASLERKKIRGKEGKNLCFFLDQAISESSAVARTVQYFTGVSKKRNKIQGKQSYYATPLHYDLAI